MIDVKGSLLVEDTRRIKDLSESNLKLDKTGKIIGYNRSKYMCQIIFQEFNEAKNRFTWTAHFSDLSELLRLLAVNEDYKYPIGIGRNMGRNMMFYAYMYPLWKKFLEGRGFKPDLEDLGKSMFYAREKDKNFDEFLRKCGGEKCKQHSTESKQSTLI